MKKFFVLWASQAASMFGSAVVGFALAWYLAKETGSATILSTAMLVNFLPMILLGPFIGPFIDRWNRKQIMIYSDLTTMLFTMVLVILFYTDTIQIWHIYVLMTLRAIGGTFQMPALSAAIPMIVPEKNLIRANGLIMTLGGIINLVGPPAGAFLMEALPMQWVLSVDIITAIIAIGCLLPLVIPQPPHSTLITKFNVIGDMVQGFRYIASWRGLLYLVILCSIVNFFAGPINSLLPLFVTDYLGGDVFKLGWLETALGAGIIAGGLVLGAWTGFKRRIYTSFMGFIIWCIAVIIFSLFTTERLFYLGIGMVLIAGFGNSFLNAPVGAILQATVAKDMLGRVFALLTSMSAAMLIPSLAIAGLVADAIGIRAVFIIAGIAMLVVTLAAFTSHDLRNIENQKSG